MNRPDGDTPQVELSDGRTLAFINATLYPSWVVFHRAGQPDSNGNREFYEAIPRDKIETIRSREGDKMIVASDAEDSDVTLDEAIPFVDPSNAPEEFEQMTISTGGEEPPPYGEGPLLGRVWTRKSEHHRLIQAAALRALATSLEDRAPDDARQPADSRFNVVGRNSDGDRIEP